MQPVNLASSSGSSDEAGSMAEEVQLTVKYLSSPKLLRLQLQDAALRRHFLVQVLRSVGSDRTQDRIARESLLRILR